MEMFPKRNLIHRVNGKRWSTRNKRNNNNNKTKKKEPEGYVSWCIQKKNAEIDCKYFSFLYGEMIHFWRVLERIWKLLIEVEIKWQDVSVLDSIIFNSKQTSLTNDTHRNKKKRMWTETDSTVNTLAALHNFFPFVSPMICIECNLVWVVCQFSCASVIDICFHLIIFKFLIKILEARRATNWLPNLKYRHMQQHSSVSPMLWQFYRYKLNFIGIVIQILW